MIGPCANLNQMGERVGCGPGFGAARPRCFRCVCLCKSSAALSYLVFVHPLSKKKGK